VNDDETVCGVDNVDGTMLRVTNAIRDAVRPDVTMFVSCRNDVPKICDTMKINKGVAKIAETQDSSVLENKRFF